MARRAEGKELLGRGPGKASMGMEEFEAWRRRAEAEGSCVPRRPSYLGQRCAVFAPHRFVCEKGGKPIRDADGRCHGCVAWDRHAPTRRKVP